MPALLPILRTFSVGRYTAGGGTAFVALIDPYPGPVDSPRMVYKYVAGGVSNFRGAGGAVPHLTNLTYTNGATIHKVQLLRPKNFTTVASAAAINQAVINITDDPGLFSTNYKYPVPGGNTVANVADRGIAANDYCAYQLKDGTWILDTVASVATLAITMTTVVPNVTGGGVAAGALFYFFGLVTDTDPATGQPQWATDIQASTNRVNLVDYIGGQFEALHMGDPLMFYSPNTTNAGILEGGAGYYSNR